MARRNSKKKKLNGFILPMPFAGLVALFCVCALSYMWLVCRCEALGRDLKALEQEREQLRKQQLNEEYKWMRMKSPQEMEKSLERHHIMMTWPRNDQVIRLSDFRLFDRPLPLESDDTIQFARIERIILNE